MITLVSTPSLDTVSRCHSLDRDLFDKALNRTRDAVFTLICPPSRNPTPKRCQASILAAFLLNPPSRDVPVHVVTIASDTDQRRDAREFKFEPQRPVHASLAGHG